MVQMRALDDPLSPIYEEDQPIESDTHQQELLDRRDRDAPRDGDPLLACHRALVDSNEDAAEYCLRESPAFLASGILSNEEGHTTALSQDTAAAVRNREVLLGRLLAIQSADPTVKTSRRKVLRLLYGLHCASLCAVESIISWNCGSAGRSEARDCGSSTSHWRARFQWKGRSYLLKMLNDSNFVLSLPEVSSVFGGVDLMPSDRNPFLLPLDVNLIMEHIPEKGSILRNQSNIDGKALLDVVPWKVDLRRVKCASSYILSEEQMISNGDMIETKSYFSCSYGCTGGDRTWLRFPLLQLNRQKLEEQTTNPKPCIEVAVVIASTRMLLGCEDDVLPPGRIQTFTRQIAFQLLRLPLMRMFEKIKAYNPEVQSVPVSTLQVLYPIVMHNRIDPDKLRRNGNASIAELAVWVRALMKSHDGERIHKSSMKGEKRRYEVAKGSDSARKITNPQIVHFFGQDGTRVGVENISTDNPSGRSVSTDCHNRKNKQNQIRTKLPSGMNGTSCIDSSSAHLDGNTSSSSKRSAVNKDRVVPLPIPCLINVIEGNATVSICRGSWNGCITRGDIIRIYHPYYSSDWTVSEDTGNLFTHEKMTLTRAYDHSNIMKKLTLSRRKADTVLNSTLDKVFDRTFTPSDDLNKLSEGLNGLRIWKLIPKRDDKRPAWRTQYDDGSVSWSNDYSDLCGYTDHFHIKIKWFKIEDYCRDDICSPKHAVHQQRAHYFEMVETRKVIDEAFDAICHWHPVSSWIDNVKWAKLSRKMRFLSGVKNFGHEIDMAFLRHSNDRKLDRTGFEFILRNIAKLQYPSICCADDAFYKMLWDTIAMLPSVNHLIWKEAKHMAVLEEARRLCAQIQISSFVRWVNQRARYLLMVSATTCLTRYCRRYIAIKKKTLLLTLVERDRVRRIQFACAKLCQKVWRGFHRRKLFKAHQVRQKNAEKKQLTQYRSQLQQERKRREHTIVFRKALSIHGEPVIVTIFLKDRHQPNKNSYLELHTYIPVTQEAFGLSLAEPVLRGYTQHALDNKSQLSWNEMINNRALLLLTDRLICRVLNGRPKILFSRRDITMRGTLISKKTLKSNGDIHILFIHRSPFDIAFRAYAPKASTELRTRISLEQLHDWIRHGEKENCNERQSQNLMLSINQSHLIDWLLQRVTIDHNPNNNKTRLLLQCDAEEEKKEIITSKIQSAWRRMVAKRVAQREVRLQFGKIFDRNEGMHCYINIESGIRQWIKPKLLGTDDLDNPPNEWQRTEQYTNAGKVVYYTNPGTGQVSWFSEEQAAQMLQRRVRERQSRDVVGSKLNLAQVARAVKFIQDTEKNFDKCPQKLSHRVNYGLLCHCVLFDFDQARVLYKDTIQKSPSHPIIARAYGIFILLTSKDHRSRSFLRAHLLFKEAAVSDPNNKMFQTAIENFFHWGVLANPNHPMALLNYALMHQCVLADYNRAEKLYRRALAVDPNNQMITENFRLFNQQRYPGGAYVSKGPPQSAVQRSKVIQDALGSGEWKKMVDPLCPNEEYKYFYYNANSKLSQFKEPDWNPS